jgi:hypothetical protein
MCCYLLIPYLSISSPTRTCPTWEEVEAPSSLDSSSKTVVAYRPLASTLLAATSTDWEESLEEVGSNPAACSQVVLMASLPNPCKGEASCSYFMVSSRACFHTDYSSKDP